MRLQRCRWAGALLSRAGLGDLSTQGVAHVGRQSPEDKPLEAGASTEQR